MVEVVKFDQFSFVTSKFFPSCGCDSGGFWRQVLQSIQVCWFCQWTICCLSGKVRGAISVVCDVPCCASDKNTIACFYCIENCQNMHNCL